MMLHSLMCECHTPLEVREMTHRQLMWLPWVFSWDLPPDAELQVVTFDFKYGESTVFILWLGDFGLYRVEPSGDFLMAIVSKYLEVLKEWHELNAIPEGSFTLQ